MPYDRQHIRPYRLDGVRFLSLVRKLNASTDARVLIAAREAAECSDSRRPTTRMNEDVRLCAIGERVPAEMVFSYLASLGMLVLMCSEEEWEDE